ncbi:hypothetical protein Nepgr_023698 [Nepenthes gracilis]|uniref:Uncharacterized protein n=1 Tax=Nepenthes gracilis TaxID=150966 RepID=A0AAD3XZC5_NEPGR|nr:hypothetical protein Nepgr_023698 [Nepenthes gracilis]
MDDFQGALSPNHKLLLKSVNLPASRLARHLFDLYGHVQRMTTSAVKHYTQPRGCQYGKENSGQIHISFPHAHWSDFQGIPGHGQVSNSCTFSHDPAAKI